MARTAEGDRLTMRHHAAQRQVRALLLRDLVRGWPGRRAADSRAVEAWLDTLAALTARHRALSGTVAARYLRAFRGVEDPGGRPPEIPDTADGRQGIKDALRYTALVLPRQAIGLRGLTPAAADQAALAETAGTAGRLALDGGRQTILATVRRDERSVGWARVTSGHACAFCGMLAGRGAVYKADTVRFRAHNNCLCSAEPSYRDSRLPPSSRLWRDRWEALPAGERTLNGLRQSLTVERAAA